MLTQKIIELKRRLIEYATLVENMIEKSIKGLLDKNEALLVEVIDRDEPKANDYDREIDEMCTKTIAQFEPVARDLRTVLMTLKMNKDLERMADHAVNISESGIFLISQPSLSALEDIPPMADTATTMLKDSIAAFIEGNVGLASAVCERDSIVDKLGDKILDELTTLMGEKKEKDVIKRSLNLMRISHNLERIADLSTNICEEVIYIVEGKDIKHHKNDSQPVNGFEV